MAETFTVNYNWTKPEVGASIDNWGGYINADLDGIDTTVKTVSNSLGNYLPLTGGTLTGTLFGTTITASGSISVTSANPTFSFRASGTQPVDQKNWDFFVDPTGNLNLRSLNDAYAAASTPLQFVRGTGYLSPTLTVSAPTLFNGKGVTFASNLGASTIDLSKHIALYGTTYGFNVTGGRLNIVGGSLAYVNTTGDDTLVISGGGNISQSNYAASNAAGNYSLSKARGGSQAASAAVLQNDFLGQVNFNGHTGSGFQQTCSLRCQITEPTPSPTAMGSQMDMLIAPLGTVTLRQAFVYKYGELQVLTTGANASGAKLSLQKSASGQGCFISSYTGTVGTAALRWQILPGNGTAEGGSNAGSDFEIRNYSDTGAQITSPLVITRSTGLATVAADPTAPLGIATKQYTDAAVAGYLPLSGGVLTGALTPAAAGIVGSTNASIPNAGAVGEALVTLVTTGVSLTTGVAATVGTLALTPGDWDISGELWVAAPSGSTILGAALNNSAAFPAAPIQNASRAQLAATFAGSNQILALAPCRTNTSVGVTYYLLASATFSSGTVTATGRIFARRMR